MARYRKVETAVWADRRFRSMSGPKPNGQTLWLYLLCGPRTTTFPGLVVAREAVIADDLGWSIDGLRAAFQETFREGLVEVDLKVGLVVLKKALLDSAGEPRDTAKPENPNVLKHWAKSWDEIPDCDLKHSYLQQLGSFAERIGEPFQKAYLEGFRKALMKVGEPLPIQDQEQKQEQESPPIPPKGGVRRPSRKAVHGAAGKAAAMVVLAKLSETTHIEYRGADKHVGLILARYSDGLDELDLRKVIAYVARPKPEGLGWAGDPNMQHYLRPETLFGPQTIERYLDAARSWFARADIPVPAPSAEFLAWREANEPQPRLAVVK